MWVVYFPAKVTLNNYPINLAVTILKQSFNKKCNLKSAGVIHFILPSGKLTKLLKITIFDATPHYKWQFSIAFCLFTRG